MNGPLIMSIFWIGLESLAFLGSRTFLPSIKVTPGQKSTSENKALLGCLLECLGWRFTWCVSL